jgi:hypothetical protein
VFDDTITIVQGSRFTYLVNLFQPNSDQPYDLTGATSIVAAHPGSDGHAVKKTLGDGVDVIGAAGAGVIRITGDATDSAAMLINPNPETLQDLQVTVVIGTNDPDILLIPEALNIVPQPYAE